MTQSQTDHAEQLAGGNAVGLTLALPEPSMTFEQGDEWCVVKLADGWREFRFHDYADIYEIKGLYEKLFYDLLKCDSPRIVCELLSAELADRKIEPTTLRVLDLGAGNGIVGEELHKLGVERVVAADILTQAADAARRDRPTVYAEYVVTDMAKLIDEDRQRLAAHRFNALTCVAALGFDDIPPACFREAFNLVDDGGSIAFTLKDEFLTDHDSTGFAGLIKRATASGALDITTSKPYRHRLAVDGTPLHYVAFVGTKRADLPIESLPETAA